MHNYDDFRFDDRSRRWSPRGLVGSLTSLLLAAAAGAYVLAKALELLGYPVRSWLSRLAHSLARVMPFTGAGVGASLDPSDTESPSTTMQRGGGLLSSIFGLSSESLLQRGVRGLTGALSSGPSNVPPGLGNMSNSCYQNSVIQGLAALPSLRDYLDKVTAEHPSFTTDTTNGALRELISTLNHPANQGRSFWIRGKLKSMSIFTQQDAQEYYSKILDELDTEMKKASSCKRRSSVSWLEATKTLDGIPTSAPFPAQREVNEAKPTQTTGPLKTTPNPLDGLIAQRVGCTSCGYSEGLSLITFNCITVSLGTNNAYDIRECLDEYTKLEYIDGVECAKCTLLKLQKTLTPLAAAQPGSAFASRLRDVTEVVEDEKFDDSTLIKTLNIPKKNWVQSSKSKQIVVARAPKSLVLHVNRSIFDEMTGAQYKNTAGVLYPKILDLGNWCLGSSPSGSGQPDMSLEEWPRNPAQSMLTETDSWATTSPFQYRLRAAVTHYGSHGNGHYVCYRPHASIAVRSEGGAEDGTEDGPEATTAERWWRFSDDTVYAIQEEQAHQGNVFMLFYERLDESHFSQAQEERITPQTVPVEDDAPLPPASTLRYSVPELEAAIAIPLPDDDDLLELIPPTSPAPLCSIAVTTEEDTSVEDTTYPSSPSLHKDINGAPSDNASQGAETDMSEAESEDAPSTQLASVFETDLVSPPTATPLIRIPPHMMRTAGNGVARERESRQSLPLVSAT
jgi:ubiquitin carboxyl-terminal hydrolase 1